MLTKLRATRSDMWEDAQGHSTRGNGAATEVKARRAQPISSQEPAGSWLGVRATLRVKIHLSGAAAVPWRARLGWGGSPLLRAGTERRLLSLIKRTPYDARGDLSQ